MGFLKKFFRGVFHEGAQAAVTHSSFERLSEEELEAHLGVQRYGRFTLTDAIRPSYDLKIVPQQGYRHDFYVDEETKTKVPVLMAAASRENLVRYFHGAHRAARHRGRCRPGDEPQSRRRPATPTCIASTSICRSSRACSGTMKTCS